MRLIAGRPPKVELRELAAHILGRVDQHGQALLSTSGNRSRDTMGQVVEMLSSDYLVDVYGDEADTGRTFFVIRRQEATPIANYDPGTLRWHPAQHRSAAPARASAP